MIVNCKDLEAKILKDVKDYVKVCDAYDIPKPKLFMLQIGNDSASSNYVNRKELKCKETGVLSETMHITRCKLEDLHSIIENRNNDPLTHGIMIQQPSPLETADNEALLQKVLPIKDVDGFTYHNVGALTNNSVPGMIPCTAKGVMQILDHHDIDVQGKLVLVIGKGRTSGRPIAQLLQNKGATVISANSKTSKGDLNNFMLIADIIISCVGKKHLVTLKDLQITYKDAIINVGMVWEHDKLFNKPRLFGDVDVKSFENEKIYENTLITTVSGSTGLLTVANLLMNTCISHYALLGKDTIPSEVKEHLVHLIVPYIK